MTFEELERLEPRLTDLMAEIRGVTLRDSISRDRLWYGRGDGFKSKMGRLVGIHAKFDNPLLQTSEAYDVCYRKLYGVLTSKSAPIERTADTGPIMPAGEVRPGGRP